MFIVYLLYVCYIFIIFVKFILYLLYISPFILFKGDINVIALLLFL